MTDIERFLNQLRNKYIPYNVFDAEAIRLAGLEGHPKANKAHDVAYEKMDRAGQEEVFHRTSPACRPSSERLIRLTI